MSAIRIRKSRPTGGKDTTTHTTMQHDSTSNDTFTTDMPIISATIARLRLTLIIGVVLIHCNVPELLRAWNGSLTGTPLWTANAIGSISLLLDRTVTSVFFFISGFLFFLNTNGFTLSQYKEKLRRRVATLLVPYILWNIVFFVLHSAKSILAAPSDCTTTDAIAPLRTFPSAFWNYADLCPADLPLWFVRDLIVVVLFTPLIHAFAKGRRAFIFIPLLFAWLWFLPQWRAVGVNPQAFLYFSLGAAFTLNRLSPVPKNSIITAGAAAVLTATAIFCVPLFGSLYDEAVRLATVGAMLAAGFGTLSRAKGTHIGKNCRILSDKVFFIYATHALFAGTTVRLLCTAIPVSGNSGMAAVYVLSPLIIITATLLLHRLISLVSPQIANVLNGKR